MSNQYTDAPSFDNPDDNPDTPSTPTFIPSWTGPTWQPLRPIQNPGVQQAQQGLRAAGGPAPTPQTIPSPGPQITPSKPKSGPTQPGGIDLTGQDLATVEAERKAGLITAADFRNYLVNVKGQSEEAAALEASLLEGQRERYGLTVSDLRELTQRGILTPQEMERRLHDDLKMSEEDAALYTKLATDPQRATSVGEIQSFVKAGLMTPQQAATKLQKLGYDADTVANYQKLFEQDQQTKGRDLTEGSLLGLLRNGSASAADVQSRLQALGYSAADAQTLVNSELKTLQDQDQQKAETLKAREQAQTATDVGKLVRGRQDQYGRQVSDISAPAAETTLERSGISPTESQGIISANTPKTQPLSPVRGGRTAPATTGSQAAAEAQRAWTQAFETHIGDLYHGGSIDPLTAHWALQNQPLFFANHLATNGTGGTMTLPSASSLQIMKQGFEFTPTRRTGTSESPTVTENSEAM